MITSEMNRFSLVTTTLASLLLAGTVAAQAPHQLVEASGIARYQGYLYVVGDDNSGVVFRYPLQKGHANLLPLPPSKAKTLPLLGDQLALDLEAIEVLKDGQIIALSERSRSLLSKDQILVQYPNATSELGNRGLEGLAIRMEKNTYMVATLWEGGRPKKKALPLQLRKKLKRFVFKPEIWIHPLPRSLTPIDLLQENITVVTLNPPKPGGGQRFRAPDVVWYPLPEEKWGFITLLNSENMTKKNEEPVYLHHWLHRFDASGNPIGDPLNLDQLAPPELRGVNWEGLDWFKPYESLVCTFDAGPETQPAALIIPLPTDWLPQPAE